METYNRLTKKQLEEKYKSEQVFVVPYSFLKDKENFFQEYQDDKILKEVVKNGLYILRSEAEYNKTFFQLIPYIIICNPETREVFASRRKAGDERLINKWSFFGGHINPPDYTSDPKENIILNAAYRELNEEVNIKLLDKNKPFNFVGTVQDIESSTGEHFGFVFVVYSKKVKIREKEILEGKWFSLSELYNSYSNFENWGKYIIDKIYKKQGNIIIPR